MRAMPSPSDLSWWGWLLCSIVALVVARVAYLFDDNRGPLPLVICIPTGIIGVLCSAIGLIRFVKWVWEA
jgi:hypothetical protein